MTGCKGNESTEGTTYVYYLNAKEDAIVPVEYTITAADIGDQVNELIERLKSNIEESDYNCAIPKGVEVETVEMGDANLSLHFSREYSTLSTTREALLRAAVVKTMTQLEGIDTVTFFVQGDPLLDSAGNIITAMTKNSIIDDFDAAQESMALTTLALYYSNAEGDALIREERKVHYNSSIPLEQVIMQYLAMQPSTEGARSIFVSYTKVLSITSSDGVCYVDLDSSVLTQENSISNDVLIYSIVNSLTELDSISHVRLGISNAGSAIVSDSSMIDGTYERNLSLVLNEAEATDSVGALVEDED